MRDAKMAPTLRNAANGWKATATPVTPVDVKMPVSLLRETMVIAPSVKKCLNI